mmetsp:Transcript_112151/g.362191  ORF Transcript_112151/g.362191 Transcript_112151/m.362191 type:complete len:172 (-) Transcript_112151:442-957(-)
MPNSKDLTSGYQMLVVPVSFLLVFRLNRAAVRFYDARAAVGKLIEISRVMVSEAASYWRHDPEARDDLCRWVVAFPVATRNYLRADAPDAYQEMGVVLSRAEAAALQKAQMQPLLCLDRMRKTVGRPTPRSRSRSPHGRGPAGNEQLRAALRRGITCERMPQTLTRRWGLC